MNHPEMDRRQFLRRSALVAGGAIAADQLDLVEQLGGWVRRLFTSVDLAPSAPGITVAELGVLYSKTQTLLYRTYARRVDEYEWFGHVPESDIIVGGGVENRIPLEIIHPTERPPLLVVDDRSLKKLRLKDLL